MGRLTQTYKITWKIIYVKQQCINKFPLKSNKSSTSYWMKMNFDLIPQLCVELIRSVCECVWEGAGRGCLLNPTKVLQLALFKLNLAETQIFIPTSFEETQAFILYLPDVFWLLIFCGSSSQCRGLVCSVCFCYFLVILKFSHIQIAFD